MLVGGSALPGVAISPARNLTAPGMHAAGVAQTGADLAEWKLQRNLCLPELVLPPTLHEPVVPTYPADVKGAGG